MRNAPARRCRVGISNMSGFPYFIIIAAACAGFFIARHIYRAKQAEEKLVCPLGFDCDTVVHSKYSHIMGVPVELGGILYYALIAAAYIVFYVSPTLLSPAVSLAALVVSGSAVLFSLYLTGVQLFALKEWCTWCLASAALCGVIFVSTLWILML